MSRIEIGDPDHVKWIHLLGTFDEQRFPTVASRERAVGRAITAVEAIHGEFLEGEVDLSLVRDSGSYRISLAIRDDRVGAAQEIGEELHRLLQELWPPTLS